MPDTGLLPDSNSAIPDVDRSYAPTHDERCRQQTVSILRKHILMDMLADMRADYDRNAKVQYAKANGREPVHAREVLQLMEDRPSYLFYSVMRYNAQEMTWASVQEPVERAAADMLEVARDIGTTSPAGGTLRLDTDLQIPVYQTAMDIHLTPGGFHSEWTDSDVSQAAVNAFGSAVFSGGIAHRRGNAGGPAESKAAYIKWAMPDFRPKRILDLGTSSGKNLFPYLDAFPEAEGYGVDVSAPLLRYGHAKAAHEGRTVHFSQQNAEKMDFADGSFDIIISTFFLHEVSLGATKRILKECQRLLAPGGIMLHLEPPFQRNLDPWMNFFWDWDSSYNNEPARIILRAQNPHTLCEEAGFAKGESLEVMVPNLSTNGPQKFAEILSGKSPCAAHGRGGWYVFGARKAA